MHPEQQWRRSSVNNTTRVDPSLLRAAQILSDLPTETSQEFISTSSANNPRRRGPDLPFQTWSLLPPETSAGLALPQSAPPEPSRKRRLPTPPRYDDPKQYFSCDTDINPTQASALADLALLNATTDPSRSVKRRVDLLNRSLNEGLIENPELYTINCSGYLQRKKDKPNPPKESFSRDTPEPPKEPYSRDTPELPKEPFSRDTDVNPSRASASAALSLIATLPSGVRIGPQRTSQAFRDDLAQQVLEEGMVENPGLYTMRKGFLERRKRTAKDDAENDTADNTEDEVGA